MAAFRVNLFDCSWWLELVRLKFLEYNIIVVKRANGDRRLINTTRQWVVIEDFRELPLHPVLLWRLRRGLSRRLRWRFPLLFPGFRSSGRPWIGSWPLPRVWPFTSQIRCRLLELAEEAFLHGRDIFQALFDWHKTCASRLAILAICLLDGFL